MKFSFEEVKEVPAECTKGAVRQKLRDEFLGQIAQYLPVQLATRFSHGEIKTFPGRNWLHVAFHEFPCSHYELRLARGFDEIAFHLEGMREDNIARLAILAPHRGEITIALEHSVVAERWGQNWARLAIDLPPAPWTDGQAQKYAALLARFIEITYPLVQETFHAVPGRRKRPRAQKKSSPGGSPDGQAHAILNQQLAQVRTFLQGRSSRPSDEVLCDWVQFCYTFELFDEGHELFNLIVPSAVNDWLYRRTKKLAQVCRIRMYNEE